MGLKTPILFLIFNRPAQTEKVLNVIRQVKPEKLYVAADGARENREDDTEKVAATRAIIDSVDWPCEVIKLFRGNNLGCKDAVSSAISWFFEQEEQGIILEDDCLPETSFFSFCGELLDRYKDNPEVMHIGGTNFQDGKKRGEGSYYFSRFAHIWGWATWRRAWQHYNVDLNTYTEEDWGKMVANYLREPGDRYFFFDSRDRIINGTLDTWDFQWTFAIWRNNGLVISPNVNMVTNIGFGQDATHTLEANKNAAMKTQPLELIVHPAKIAVDKKADKFTAETLFRSSTFEKYKWRIKQALKRLFK